MKMVRIEKKLNDRTFVYQFGKPITTKIDNIEMFCIYYRYNSMKIQSDSKYKTLKTISRI